MGYGKLCHLEREHGLPALQAGAWEEGDCGLAALAGLHRWIRGDLETATAATDALCSTCY